MLEPTRIIHGRDTSAWTASDRLIPEAGKLRLLPHPKMERLTNKQYLVDRWPYNTLCGRAMLQLRKIDGPEVTSPGPEPPWKIAGARVQAAALERPALRVGP